MIFLAATAFSVGLFIADLIIRRKITGESVGTAFFIFLFTFILYFGWGFKQPSEPFGVQPPAAVQTK